MTTADAAAVAAAMKTEIKALMEAGTVPADVPSFSALHDYVDANMLAFEVYGTEPAEDETDEQAEERMDRETPIFNAASDEVDRWLKVRAMLGPETAPELSPCCGAHVTYSGDGDLYCKACFRAVGH